MGGGGEGKGRRRKGKEGLRQNLQPLIITRVCSRRGAPRAPRNKEGGRRIPGGEGAAAAPCTSPRRRVRRGAGLSTLLPLWGPAGLGEGMWSFRPGETLPSLGS